jgi:hypothetical protein
VNLPTHKPKYRAGGDAGPILTRSLVRGHLRGSLVTPSEDAEIRRRGNALSTRFSSDPDLDPKEEEPVDLILWGSLVIGIISTLLVGYFLLQFLAHAFRGVLG